MSNRVTREAFFAANDLPREKVTIPRLGDVWVRVVTAEERETWEAAAEGPAKAKSQIRALMVAMTACDEDGTPLFGMDDVPALAKRPVTFIMPLFEAAIRLSRVTPADVDALEKNSDASPSDSSASGLPPT